MVIAMVLLVIVLIVVMVVMVFMLWVVIFVVERMKIVLGVMGAVVVSIKVKVLLTLTKVLKQ